ncbi:UPF0481 protein At3g47200 [Cajanus cajan]|uniref:UPF0481 protein At3g47200 n=1 Tax=Cajanus cajan TaxID=3821 RepID=UPI00098DB989|nr:UPF0481 protein At3g47200 [Cajanus cajan]
MSHDDIAIDIRSMLERAEPHVTDECCIYRVPFGIRRLNEDAYTPKVVSIGPFHHNSHPRLQSMENYKLHYCKTFLARTQRSLDDWICYIEEIELPFRRCYSDPLEFSKEDLVKIIFVDSGFIIELFWKCYYDELAKDDMFIRNPWLFTNIKLDLLLLENQLPFFVLDSLFNSCISSPSSIIPSFIELTFEYFADFNRSNLLYDNVRIRHFTDLIRTFHLRSEPGPPRHLELVKHLPSATDLLEVGVRFRAKVKSTCLLDLNFSKGVLEIPQLIVEYWTEPLFRNMIALEQCHYPFESYITDYANVMDFLVNTSTDVDILIKTEVLVNRLGDTIPVANMFNGLLNNITQTSGNPSYLAICRELNAFYRNPYQHLKWTLRRDYFRTPWQTAVNIGGIFLLILTLVQSVCSVLQVIQQFGVL